MAVSCLTREVLRLLRKEETVSVSDIIEFVIMLCGVAMLFYTIGRDKNDSKSENTNTKK